MGKNQVVWSIISGHSAFLRTNLVGDRATLTTDPFSFNNRHGLANCGKRNLLFRNH